MVKYILLCGIILGLVACKDNTVKPTNYVPVKQVVYKTPAPPKVDRPILYINTITARQTSDIGLLSQAYLITAVQLKEYACELETIVNEYKVLSASEQNTLPTVSLTQEQITQCKQVTLPQSLSNKTSTIPDLVNKYFQNH